MLNSYIWPTDKTLSGATSTGQSGPGVDDNEELSIPQSSSITGASPLDCLMSYPRHLLAGEVLSFSRDVVNVFYSPTWLERSEWTSEQGKNKKNEERTDKLRKRVVWQN